MPLRQRLRKLWDYRLRIPITLLGLALLLAAYLTYEHYGIEEQDYVLAGAAVVAALLLALTIVMVLITSLLLKLRLRRIAPGSDLELVSGQRMATGFVYPPFRGLPLVQVELSWVVPHRVAVAVEPTRAGLAEVIEPAERGAYPAVRRRFTVGDIFGLSRFALECTERRPCRIRPQKAQVSSRVLSQFSAGDAISHPSGPVEGELIDMRRYNVGDPMRRILWKAFARSRQLLVRTPERAITPNPSAMAYFVAGQEDEASASAARYFIEEGILGSSLLFRADGAPRATTLADEAVEQVIHSVAHRQQGGAGLSQFLQSADSRKYRNLVLFLPPIPGRWLSAVEQAAKHFPQATAVIGVGQRLGQEPARALRRLFFAGQSDATFAELPNVIRRLRRVGLTLHVIHHPSGQLIPLHQLELATE
jgi:hypothetical protein